MTVLNAHIKNSSQIASIYATLPKHNICFSSIFAHRDLMLMVERKTLQQSPLPPSPFPLPSVHPDRENLTIANRPGQPQRRFFHTHLATHQLPIASFRCSSMLEEGPHTMNLFCLSCGVCLQLVYIYIYLLFVNHTAARCTTRTSDCCSVYYTSRRVAEAFYQSNTPSKNGHQDSAGLLLLMMPELYACYLAIRGYVVQNVRFMLCCLFGTL